MDKKDNYLKNLAKIEQATEEIKLFAQPLYAYYASLVKEGFNDNQALMLVLNMQEIMFRGDSGNDN